MNAPMTTDNILIMLTVDFCIVFHCLSVVEIVYNRSMHGPLEDMQICIPSIRKVSNSSPTGERNSDIISYFFYLLWKD